LATWRSFASICAMAPETLDDLTARMQCLLGNPAISDCANRKGNRAQSAKLLEDAYVGMTKALSPELSVEIGAHEAGFSRRVMAAVPELNAIAFEANPHVYEKYLPGLRAETLDYRNLAICATAGPVKLWMPRTWQNAAFPPANAISSVRQRTNDDFAYDIVTVDGLPLDDALAGLTYETAVAWIDVEGAQREILEGAPTFLSRALAIYIELETIEVWQGQDTAAAITKTLKQCGFRAVMRDAIARVQFNEVFVRTEPGILHQATQAAAAYVERLERLLR